MTDFYRCGHCGGTGCIELTGEHAKTLETLRKQKQPISGADMGRIMGCSGEAMCNRLRYLGGLGQAAYSRHGREKLWQATKRKAEIAAQADGGGGN